MTPSRRRALALGALTGVLLLAASLEDRRDPPPPAPPHAGEVQQRFEQAAVMLHARQFEHAVTALHRVLALAPELPEAHVNMGFALLGLKRPREARDFFEGATALRPGQANAYYGLALAHEAEGDLALATGAMRSYLHLARDERAEHLSRARAALWEWQQARAADSRVRERVPANGEKRPAGATMRPPVPE